MNNISIDIETLGTNIDSAILSVGACVFDNETGGIIDAFYRKVSYDDNEPINATLGTIKFWLGQAKENYDAVASAFDDKDDNDESTPLCIVLLDLADFISQYPDAPIWANGTKFDLGMLEYQFKFHDLDVPWSYSADRCMRTLRQYAGHIEIDHKGIAHDALDDAVWQAKYISAALNKLNLINIED